MLMQLICCCLVLMENRQDFEASNMGETMKGSLLKQAPGENTSEDILKLHEVLRGLNVGMKMPPNALTYEQVFISPIDFIENRLNS